MFGLMSPGHLTSFVYFKNNHETRAELLTAPLEKNHCTTQFFKLVP